jgi:hypothetical protein
MKRYPQHRLREQLGSVVHKGRRAWRIVMRRRMKRRMTPIATLREQLKTREALGFPVNGRRGKNIRNASSKRMTRETRISGRNSRILSRNSTKSNKPEVG